MELGQRFVLVWTLIVSCAVVFTNGDIIGSPGDIRQGYKLLQAPVEVDTNTEEPKSSRPHKASNVIVQPVQRADSKVANRQTNPSLAPRPAKDEGAKSDDSKSIIANGVVASNRDTKLSNPRVSPPKNPGEQKGNTQDPKSANPPKNSAVQPSGKRKPKDVSSQSIPLNNVVVQPIYEQSDPRLGNPRSDSSSNVGISPGSNFAVQSSYQQRYTGENVHSTPMEKTQLSYYSYYSNPHSRFPVRTIAIQQPQYERNAWVGIPVQPVAPHIQPVYVQSSNLGISEIETSKDVVIRPRYGQGYWDGIGRSNSLGNLPVQPVYEGSSGFSHPGYEPTRPIAIQPGYGQDSGILNFNPPVNIEVQPKYEPSSRAGVSQPNPPNRPPGQSAIEQNHQFTNPTPNPIANVPAQPANEPDPRARLSPGYPTINIAFLRGYESPNLRAEQPQSIPQPATNPAVQPTQETLQPKKGIPQPAAIIGLGADFVPNQKAPLFFPTDILEKPENQQTSSLVANSQGYVPINSKLPAQSPPNPAVQPTRGNVNSREGISQAVPPFEFGTGFVPNQKAPMIFPTDILEKPEYQQASPLVGGSQWYVPINSDLYAQSPPNPAVQPTRGNVNSREGIPQAVPPFEFGTGFVPNQKAPMIFPTDILEKPEYQQASPLIGSSQWYVPINSDLSAQSPTNPAIQSTHGNVNSREGISQAVPPFEFGTGFVPNQKAPMVFPTDILEKPEHHQASPLVGGSQWYVPINSDLSAQSPTNPREGNVNSREGIPQAVVPIEFGTTFVPNLKAPILFPTDILEKPEYQQASPLVGSSQWYVPIDREIPTDQRSSSSHRETQAAQNIALQSGHAKPIFKVIATETTPPREVLVQSGYGQLHCHLKFIPQGNFALSVPKDSTLKSEIQRNKDLHQLVTSQLHSMQKQPHILHPQEIRFGKPGLFASQSSGLNPLGGKGSKKKKNGWGITPLFLRSTNPSQCTERNQYPRSLNSDSGPNGGHGEPVWNYPETSSISRRNISEAVNSIIPKVNATLNSLLNSTLNGIRPHQEQGNSTNLITGITTGIVDAAKTLEKKVSDVISPILGSQINGDPQKNPNNSQSPQASNSNVSQNGNQGAYDVKQLGNNQGNARFPTMNNPNDMAKFVNEYGRNFMDAVPSTFNSAVDNSNAYLKGFYDNLKAHVH